MDPPESDGLVVGAANPGLIPGIHNYCDQRCSRCRFTKRCLAYPDTRDLELMSAPPVEVDTGEGSRRALGISRDVADDGRIPATGLIWVSGWESARADRSREPDHPVAHLAREYGQLAWRISHALLPIIERRGDAAVIEAVATIEWFTTMISSKIARAFAGRRDRCDSDADAQSDFNGSAKMALIGIEQSRAAWTVLMQAGRATANGVPAQAVRMLDTLDRDLRLEFPEAVRFVRPGFDQPELRDRKRGE